MLADRKMKVRNQHDSPRPTNLFNSRKTPPLHHRSSTKSSLGTITSSQSPCETGKVHQIELNFQYFEDKIDLLESKQKQLEDFFKQKIQNISNKIRRRDEENSILKSSILSLKSSLTKKKEHLKQLKSIERLRKISCKNHRKQTQQQDKKSRLMSLKGSHQSIISVQKEKPKQKTKLKVTKLPQIQKIVKLSSCKSLF